MKKIYMFQILFFYILISSCVFSTSERATHTSSPTIAIEYNTLTATKEIPTTPVFSIPPAVNKKPKLHDLALNENNVDKVENLTILDTPSQYCIISSLDTALTTRYMNGRVDYLLATKDNENKSTQIWNLIEEKIVQTISDDYSHSILFHPDHRNLVSFVANETANFALWNIQTGQQQKFVLAERHHYDDRYMSISQDGINIALITDFGIKEFNLQNNQAIDTNYKFPFYRDTPPAFIYSPTGNLIAVAHGYDENLHLLDLSNQEDVSLEFPFTNIMDAVEAEAIISTISISSNEKYIAGGALNGTIYLWDFADGTLLNSFDAHEISMDDGWVGGVKILAFSPESYLLVSVGYDSFTKLWDTRKGVLLKEINTCHRFGGFTEDGRYLVTVGEKGTELWGIP